MRLAIQAVVSDIEGQETHTEDIGILEYAVDAFIQRQHYFKARYWNLVVATVIRLANFVKSVSQTESRYASN